MGFVAQRVLLDVIEIMRLDSKPWGTCFVSAPSARNVRFRVTESHKPLQTGRVRHEPASRGEGLGGIVAAKLFRRGAMVERHGN